MDRCRGKRQSAGVDAARRGRERAHRVARGLRER
jgi:hypothetical protein